MHKKLDSIVFILEQNGFSPNKESTTLRLIIHSDQRYYIFLDFPKGKNLRETHTPLHKDRNRIFNLDEDEAKAFLRKVFEQDKIDVSSFWTA